DANVTAHEQYFFQRIVNLLRSVLNPFLTLPLLLMGYKSISLVMVTTLLTLGSLLVNVWFCFKKLKIRFSFKHFEIHLFKEIAVFSSFVFLNMITDQINWSVDKFILGVLAGTAGVAVYSIAAQLNTYYLNFSTSISSVFIPRINCIVAENSDNKQLTEIFTKVGRIQFVILSLIISGYIVLGQAFIYFWAGSDYTSSYFVGLWLMIPGIIPLIQNLGIEIQRAKNMHKFRSIVYIFIAIGNILLSIPLCKLYGPVGCAVGTAISLLIGNGLIMNWYYQKKIGLDIKYFWYEIAKFIPSLIIPGIMCVIILLFVKIQTISALLLWGIAYVIIFILSIWKFGLNDYERNLFSSPIKKLANHFKRG
ncbi:MAG: oligosaccharide flippase family protein, partial [Eubacterium sp.]